MTFLTNQVCFYTSRDLRQHNLVIMPRFRLVIENPSPWFDKTGRPNNWESMFQILTSLLDSKNIPYTIEGVHRPPGLAPKVLDANEALISFHSAGGYSNRIIRIKPAYIAGYFYFDPMGFSGWARLAQDAQTRNTAFQYDKPGANEVLNQVRQRYYSGNSSKYSQPPLNPKLKHALPSNFVFYPMQTSNDMVLELSGFRPAKLLLQLAKLCRRTNINLVVKRHPAENHPLIADFINRVCGKSGGWAQESHASINDLLPNCSKVVAINSGVGFEALLYGKEVLCLGRSDYECLGRTINNFAELESALQTDGCLPESKADNYLGWMIAENWFSIDDATSLDRKLSVWLASPGDISAEDWGPEIIGLSGAEPFSYKSMRRLLSETTAASENKRRRLEYKLAENLYRV